MGALDNFPVGDVLGFVRTIADRCWDRSGRTYQEIAIVLSIEEGRLVWAASKWIEVLLVAEVKSQGAHDFTLEELQWMLTEKVNGMKHQTDHEKVLWLDRREMTMVMDVETHLALYASRAAKKWSNPKKGKKN